MTDYFTLGPTYIYDYFGSECDLGCHC